MLDDAIVFEVEKDNIKVQKQVDELLHKEGIKRLSTIVFIILDTITKTIQAESKHWRKHYTHRVTRLW